MFFTTYLQLIFGLNVPFLRSLFVFSLSARAARTVICSFFVRSLFVLCSSFVRSLFVLCSSFLRLLFVFCSSFVRLLFVFCSSFVRLFSICPCGSHYLPVRLALSARAARTVLRLSVRLAPACVAHTFNSSFFTKLLPHTY